MERQDMKTHKQTETKNLKKNYKHTHKKTKDWENVGGKQTNKNKQKKTSVKISDYFVKSIFHRAVTSIGLHVWVQLAVNNPSVLIMHPRWCHFTDHEQLGDVIGRHAATRVVSSWYFS